MHSTFQTWATDVVPEARGTAAGLFAMALFTGAAIATVAMAPLADAHRFGTIFAIGAALTLPVLAGGPGPLEVSGGGSAQWRCDTLKAFAHVDADISPRQGAC